jgi:hypothetical protein
VLLFTLFIDLIKHVCRRLILWHVDSLLGNDREISNYTTAVTRQRPVNSKRGTVFCVRPVPKCYKQDKLGVGQLVTGLL